MSFEDSLLSLLLSCLFPPLGVHGGFTWFSLNYLEWLWSFLLHLFSKEDDFLHFLQFLDLFFDRLSWMSHCICYFIFSCNLFCFFLVYCFYSFHLSFRKVTTLHLLRLNSEWLLIMLLFAYFPEIDGDRSFNPAWKFSQSAACSGFLFFSLLLTSVTLCDFL